MIAKFTLAKPTTILNTPKKLSFLSLTTDLKSANVVARLKHKGVREVPKHGGSEITHGHFLMTGCDNQICGASQRYSKFKSALKLLELTGQMDSEDACSK